MAETQQVLLLNDLRGRIRVQTDASCKPGRTWPLLRFLERRSSDLRLLRWLPWAAS